VVNVGRIAEYAAAGRFGVEVVEGAAAASRKGRKKSSAPLTVNPAVLASAGLIRSDSRPVKVLGHGEVDVAMFIAAEAFTASARSKIEAAGGFVQLLAADGQPAPEPVEAVATPAAPTTDEAATSEPAAAEPTDEAAAPAKRAPRRRKTADDTSEE
jgi:hypothetical protein